MSNLEREKNLFRAENYYKKMKNTLQDVYCTPRYYESSVYLQ